MNTRTCDCDHKATDLIDEALGRFQDGDLDGAEELYARATSHGDPSAALLTLGGCIGGERGAFDEALESFEQALKQDPCFVVALVDAAELQLDALGDAEGCLKRCERALALTDDDPEARMKVLTYRARALMQLDRDQEAREAIEAKPRGSRSWTRMPSSAWKARRWPSKHGISQIVLFPPLCASSKTMPTLTTVLGGFALSGETSIRPLRIDCER